MYGACFNLSFCFLFSFIPRPPPSHAMQRQSRQKASTFPEHYATVSWAEAESGSRPNNSPDSPDDDAGEPLLPVEIDGARKVVQDFDHDHLH